MSLTTEVISLAEPTPCQVYDRDMWFAEKKSSKVRAEAAALCRQCPIALACLTAALERGEEHGIWGGLTPEQRRVTTMRRIA